MPNIEIPPRIKQDAKRLLKEGKLDQKQIEQLGENLYQGKSVYLHGPVMSGKTMLAASILLQAEEHDWAMEHHRLALLACDQLSLDLMPDFSNPKHSPSAYLKELQNEVHWLVLDDLGTERVSEWNCHNLSLLIKYRLDWLKPTIITSNLTIDQLCERSEDPRLLWRIQESCVVAEIKRK